MRNPFRIDWVTIIILLVLLAVAVIGTIIIFGPQGNSSFSGPVNALQSSI